jgi:hypothetical protein
MSIVLKDKIKVDSSFISELIAKSWEDSESIQNQIDSIEIDSTTAAKTVKLLKDLLTSYYVFTGCLETLENEPIEIVEPNKIPKPKSEVIIPEKLTIIPEEPVEAEIPDIDVVTELGVGEADSEPFEYFVDFDEPVGEPLTDEDLYN